MKGCDAPCLAFSEEYLPRTKDKILFLALYKEAFDVMVTGEKDKEYRKPSDWIKSRVLNKDGTAREYDYIKFVNGYGSDKPYFIIEFIQLFTSVKPIQYTYSNGLKVDVEVNDFVIQLGGIVEKGNLKK
jgi:hypothetical protein